MPDPEYDADLDMSRGVEEAYREIRARMARGEPGWMPKEVRDPGIAPPHQIAPTGILRQKARPFAVDLFCGLPQPHFGWRAYLLIKQFVAGRAEYPYHMAAAVRHEAPSAIALISRAVRYLKYPVFRAGFA